MNKVSFLFSLYESSTGERITTTSVKGSMGPVLKEISSIVKGYESTFGEGKVLIKTLKVRLGESVLVERKKMNSLNTLLTLVTEHYDSQETGVIVESNTPKNIVLENLSRVLSNPKKTKKLLEVIKKAKATNELELPDLEKGDILLVGKFKNRRAEIKGFDTDEHGQPIAHTTKGDQKIFKPRIEKLIPENHRIYLLPGGAWEHFDLSVGENIAEGKDSQTLATHLQHFEW